MRRRKVREQPNTTHGGKAPEDSAVQYEDSLHHNHYSTPSARARLPDTTPVDQVHEDSTAMHEDKLHHINHDEPSPGTPPISNQLGHAQEGGNT